MFFILLPLHHWNSVKYFFGFLSHITFPIMSGSGTDTDTDGVDKKVFSYYKSSDVSVQLCFQESIWWGRMTIKYYESSPTKKIHTLVSCTIKVFPCLLLHPNIKILFFVTLRDAESMSETLYFSKKTNGFVKLLVNRSFCVLFREIFCFPNKMKAEQHSHVTEGEENN